MLFDILTESLILESKIELGYLSENGDDIDEDFDSNDVLDQLEAIFKKCNIGITRDKNFTIFARNGDKVLGGIASMHSYEDMPENAFSNLGESEPKQYIEYTFDIAVDPQFQKGTIGFLLMRAAIQQALQLKTELDVPVLCKNWVVNPVAGQMLEKFFGFTQTDEFTGEGYSAHYEKWL